MATLSFELFVSLDHTLRMIISSKIWKFSFSALKKRMSKQPSRCLLMDWFTISVHCYCLFLIILLSVELVLLLVLHSLIFFSSENLLEGFCMTFSIPRAYLSVREFADSGLMHWDRRQRASFCLQGVNLPSSIGDYLSPAAAEPQDPNHVPCWSQRQEKRSLKPRNYLMLVWVKMLKSCCTNWCFLILLNEKDSESKIKSDGWNI